MQSDLIIVTFLQEDRACQARQALEIMRGKQLFRLDNAALVTRDRTGRASVHQRWDLPFFPRGRREHLPVLFADAVFGSTPEEGVQKLAGAGLDEIFLREVATALEPESSALLIYVPSETIADTRRLLDVLELFDGKLHHTSMPAAVENAILAQAEAE